MTLSMLHPIEIGKNDQGDTIWCAWVRAFGVLLNPYRIKGYTDDKVGELPGSLSDQYTADEALLFPDTLEDYPISLYFLHACIHIHFYNHALEGDKDNGVTVRPKLNLNKEKESHIEAFLGYNIKADDAPHCLRTYTTDVSFPTPSTGTSKDIFIRSRSPSPYTFKEAEIIIY